jgi:hypothetical protein
LGKNSENFTVGVEAAFDVKVGIGVEVDEGLPEYLADPVT